MRSSRNAAITGLRSQWTYPGCLPLSSKPQKSVLPYSNKALATPKEWTRKHRFAWAAASGSLGLGIIISLQDELKHGVQAVQRSSRVLSALLLNIKDYHAVLQLPGDSENGLQFRMQACHQRCADRTLRVLEQNGSIFIKLGQHLSSMNYLLPLEWTRTFIPLQDKCPVSSIETIEQMFLDDTGQPIASHFDHFDQEPIGAASLAQVHLATMKDTGTKVAVKVQHPALQEWVPLDLALTRFTFSTLKYFFPEYDLEWLSNEMESSLPQELDFAIEGENALTTKRHFDMMKDIPLVIPDVLWGRKRILVMEYIAGHRTDDIAYLDSNGIDRDEVSAAMARIFNEMIFGETPLHCDPHGGNIAIRRNGRRRTHNFDLILYDHGLYRDIPVQLKRDYAKLWLAVINADEGGMRRYARLVAGITDEQFPLFASTITGRDYKTVTMSVVSTRSEKEKEVISGALGEGMLQQLVKLLGQVPRIILLILKTNDLTRSLDESLQTRDGPVRNFLILAHYCSRTVFQEQMELLGRKGRLFWPRNALHLLAAWISYARVEAKLLFYEWYISLRRIAHSPFVANS
ncbi:MAG: hypothetical protein Q9220_004180 [cf. Caloplaca sp. 1 TL-2023]